MFKTQTWALVILELVCCSLGLCAGQAEPGLMVTYSSGEANDTGPSPNISLFVEAGKSASPFVPAGKFTATWEGMVSAELRGDFSFQADLNGSLKLEINGAIALEASSQGGPSPLSKPVQLNKGPNALKAIFTSPAKGDAFVRLGWTEKEIHTSPIPLTVLSHNTSPALEHGLRLRSGRELFLEHRCVRCHTAGLTEPSVPELRMDAPSFAGIGARRNYEWMSLWILEPKSIRPTARMPKLLHGKTAPQEAAAMAAYLATLQQSDEPARGRAASINGKPIHDPKYIVTDADLKPSTTEAAPSATEGEPKPLFERLHCIGCHNTPDSKEADPKKIPLQRIGRKFPPGKLEDFLRAPEEHYAWIRMPNFRLSAAEAKELSAYLLAKAGKAERSVVPTIRMVLERGKALVQTSGCLNCHELKLENKATTRPLAALVASAKQDKSKAVKGDCLGSAPVADYGFLAAEKAVLGEFIESGAESISRHVPSEFAERQTRDLNCAACHGQVEGFPPLEIQGGKLRPEWAAQFIGGELNYKPRAVKHPKGEPWLEMRMPAFGSRARQLAEGLAAQHGYSPKTPPEGPMDPQFSRIGQKLVGTDGGFSCVVCHGVGSLQATGVFESEGINLSYSAERLLPDYYRRWMRNPASIDLQTKMPAYFADGKSQMTDVLEGDAERQLTAIWQYLRLGGKMPAPSTGAQ